MTAIDDDIIAALLTHAEAVRERAYAPYSNFPVGAALLLEDGSMAVGCNVENASYPLGLCAERSAVARAVALGKRHFIAVAVVGRDSRTLWPCGGCRQVLSEFGDLWVVSLAPSPLRWAKRKLSQLLPESFGEEDLT